MGAEPVRPYHEQYLQAREQHGVALAQLKTVSVGPHH